jgi:hypothetical protein
MVETKQLHEQMILKIDTVKICSFSKKIEHILRRI